MSNIDKQEVSKSGDGDKRVSKIATEDWKDDATNDDDVKENGAATFVLEQEGFIEILAAESLREASKEDDEVDNCDTLWEEDIELATVGDNV